MRYTRDNIRVAITVAKQSFKTFLHKLPHLKTWQLVVIVLLISLVSATFLRLNNLEMIERRTAVLSADQKGDKEEIRASLVNLQNYMSHHMNTQLNGGLYLSESYNRDRDAALEVANSTSNPNSAVYQQASIECRARWQGGVASFRNDYVQCVIDKVSALSASTDPTASLRLPSVSSYRYDFASPLISFDLAGISVLITVILLLIILGRIISNIVLSLVLRRHYQSV